MGAERVTIYRTAITRHRACEGMARGAGKLDDGEDKAGDKQGGHDNDDHSAAEKYTREERSI